jgi:hypothetical protein
MGFSTPGILLDKLTYAGTNKCLPRIGACSFRVSPQQLMDEVSHDMYASSRYPLENNFMATTSFRTRLTKKRKKRMEGEDDKAMKASSRRSQTGRTES